MRSWFWVCVAAIMLLVCMVFWLGLLRPPTKQRLVFATCGCEDCRTVFSPGIALNGSGFEVQWIDTRQDADRRLYEEVLRGAGLDPVADNTCPAIIETPQTRGKSIYTYGKGAVLRRVRNLASN